MSARLRLTSTGPATSFLNQRLTAMPTMPTTFLGLERTWALTSSGAPRAPAMLHSSAAAAAAAQCYSGSGSGSGRSSSFYRQQESAMPRDRNQDRDRRDGPPPSSRQRQSEEADPAYPPHPELPPHEFFVTCHPGLELTVARELQDLGIQHGKPGKAGVSFWSSSVADGYRACLWLRSAIRVLLLLSRQRLETDPGAGYRSGDSLYEATRMAAQWQDLILPDQTFAVDSRVWSCTDLTSSHFASLRVKDAICDALRDARATKPPRPAPGETADVPLYIACHRDVVSVFRDLTGQSLHRRGYRDAMHKAPLNEAAAAGVLLLAGWKELSGPGGAGADAVLADPMCGSGTLLSEAALIARNVAPGLLRPAAAWPFRRWPDADQAGIRAAVEEARDLARPWNGRLLGNDLHPGALDLARRDAGSAGIEGIVQYREGDCKTWQLGGAPTLVVTNPPWGLRLNAEEEGGERGRGEEEGEGRREGGRAREAERARRPEGRRQVEEEVGGGEVDSGLEVAWRSLSEFLRSQCAGSTAYILSGNPEAFTILRVKASRKDVMKVGGVEVKLHQVKMLPPKQKEAAAAAPMAGAGKAASDDEEEEDSTGFMDGIEGRRPLKQQAAAAAGSERRPLKREARGVRGAASVDSAELGGAIIRDFFAGGEEEDRHAGPDERAAPRKALGKRGAVAARGPAPADRGDRGDRAAGPTAPRTAGGSAARTAPPPKEYKNFADDDYFS